MEKCHKKESNVYQAFETADQSWIGNFLDTESTCICAVRITVGQASYTDVWAMSILINGHVLNNIVTGAGLVRGPVLWSFSVCTWKPPKHN